MAQTVNVSQKPFVSSLGGLVDTGTFIINGAADKTLSKQEFDTILANNATVLVEDNKTGTDPAIVVKLPLATDILASMKSLTADADDVAINATGSSIKAGAVKFIYFRLVPPSPVLNHDNDGYGFRLMPTQVSETGDIYAWRKLLPYNDRTKSQSLMTPLALMAGIDVGQDDAAGNYNNTRLTIQTNGGVAIGRALSFGETGILMITCLSSTTVDYKMLHNPLA